MPDIVPSFLANRHQQQRTLYIYIFCEVFCNYCSSLKQVTPGQYENVPVTVTRGTEGQPSSASVRKHGMYI